MKSPFTRLAIAVLLVAAFLLLPSRSSLEAAYGDLLWKMETGNTIYAAPAIGPNGEIVIGSEDTSVYSYNPDGSLRWICPDPTDWIDSSPTIGSDGTVYVGSWDNFVYAIDGDSGIVKWKVETGALIISSPTIGPDGTIYIGSNDSFLYAINPDGSQKWISEAVDSFSPINSSPVLNTTGDTVYFGNDNGELFAVSAATGTNLWSFSVTAVDPPADGEDYALVGSPAIGKGGNIYFGSENGKLYSLSSSGSLRWSFETVETIRSSPAISDNGTIYFAAQDGYLYAVDSEGFQLWETFVGDVFYCSPALDADGNILICGYDGSVELGVASLFTSVNQNGEIIWEYLIINYNDSSPNIAPDGSIYFGAHDGSLYKFEGSASLADGQWPRFQANRRQTGFQPDLDQQEMIDLFPSITQILDGWVHVPWFGSGWIHETGMPWIQHEEHGMLYIISNGLEDVQYYDFALAEWIFSAAAAPHFYFLYSNDTWLYHAEGTTIQTRRYFYDLSQSEWIGTGW